MSTPKLALYHYETCYYCRVVRNAIDELALGDAVELRNVRENPDHRRELIDARGRKTVPVLRIEDEDGRVTWMPESRIIVRFLRGLRQGTSDTRASAEEGERLANRGIWGLLSRWRK